MRSIIAIHMFGDVSIFLSFERRIPSWKQVQLSIRANDLFIGTVLKSLEIEDLVGIHGVSQPCYLARSFIHSSNAHSSSDDAAIQSLDSNDLTLSEGEKFYEAPENLADSTDNAMQSPQTVSKHLSPQYWLPSEKLSLKTPSFNRVAGLVPDNAVENRMEDTEVIKTLDSFVKAQIVIYDQNSPLYNNIDKRVGIFVCLSFCFYLIKLLMISDHVNNCFRC